MNQKITKKPFQHTIAVDFDGTLHQYDKRWRGIDIISDGPVAGAMKFLKAIVDDPELKVVIVSSRLRELEPEGMFAIQAWLGEHLENEFGREEAQRIAGEIGFANERPPASVTIDDRAWAFQGIFPTTDDLKAFKPWNKRTDIVEAAAAEIDAEDDVPVRTVAVIRTDLPEQWKTTARRITLDGVEHYLVDGRELTGDDEAEVDGIALGIGDVPERMAQFAAARGKTVDEVLADPDVLTLDNLDAVFASYAEIEPIVVEAVPPGCRLSRAIAGGHPGWRIGSGWLCADQAHAGEWEDLGEFVRRLAAIPSFEGRLF